MDAGRRDSDRSSRKRQLEHIIKTIKQKTSSEALIVAGDLNLNSKNLEDVKLLENFKEELRLSDAFEETKISKKWTILDYFLYKQGEELDLKIISTGEDESFVTGEGALSDHPALVIELSL
jgi:endonuclease/exonuclease/phosphatase family metal-dependent hydrolase